MNYLKTDKSVLISSPAGSGKTEKLARRYISLLQHGVPVERILAITFTDKAAAEMKQRILRILNEEDHDSFLKLLDKMPLMRVSTIHSFCGTLLRRFSFEAAIDPNYRVNDAIDSNMTWEEILYEVLMDAGKGSNGHDLFLQAISEKGFRGLAYLQSTADYLFQKSPFSLDATTFKHAPLHGSFIEELKSWPGADDVIEGYRDFFADGPHGNRVRFEKYFLTKSREPRKNPDSLLKKIDEYRDWAYKMYLCWKDKVIQEHVKRTDMIRDIYRKCLATYMDVKRGKSTLDFSDLEYIAFKMLTENPEWANILYAFDEKTDHILVDEFQDTNTFQWEIINKLTEEWRSGMGAKREEGIKPTIFLVGDVKQSIYYFRGANIEIFQEAKDTLAEWLGDEFYYEEVKENYRSRPAIVEFTNLVFSKIMQAGEDDPPWIATYNPCHAHRPGIPDMGRVELILLDDDSHTTSDAKLKEADILSQRIQGLAGNFQITDRSTRQQRPCTYMDMAVLLRKRTHLKKYEEAFRKYTIPFVAVKGIGFYQEPEISMLRALVYFLSNPADDYSLYVLLKSPLFQIDERNIIKLIGGGGDSLFSKLKARTSSMKSSDSLNRSLTFLEEWLSQIPSAPVSELIEGALINTKAWRYFHEPQRRANIKKFIRIIEDLESRGKSVLKLRDFLERTCNKNEEPKANVNTEGMDAVKIMTIHAAKGLEFPIVFIPGIEEPFTINTGENLIYEKEGKFYFKSESELAIRKQDEDFMIHKAKEEEEQKRLFYVAVTRAEEALVLLSHWSSKDRNFLAFLKQGLGLERKEKSFRIDRELAGLSLLVEDDVNTLFKHPHRRAAYNKPLRPVEATRLSVRKRNIWRAVTETVDIKSQHGKDRVVLGDIMHRIFEAVSKSTLEDKDILTRAWSMLESKGIPEEQRKDKLSVIENEIITLKQKGLWQSIIAPREGSFAELPFIYEADNVVYTGRIDRIIVEHGTFSIYDYKTFPVKENEIVYLLREYAFQLNLYKRAVMMLFQPKIVKSYVVFTHRGVVREVSW